MHTKHTIAGVVLTLNEEEDLARALKSLAWCDEIFVVDSGSSDQTCEVAINCGARILEHLQDPPFLISEQRNWALNCGLITSDWVLFLDADEEVSTPLANLIRQQIQNSPSIEGFELAPRYWFLGKWLKWTQGYPNWHPRLVKRGHIQFQGGVWESFSQPSNIGQLHIPYEHYAFSKGIDNWLQRHCRYAEWDAHIITTPDSFLPSNRLYTSRHYSLRRLAARFWFLRPPARFFHKYILHLGIVEGWQGLLFAVLMAIYEVIVIIKVIELRRKSAGLEL